MFGKASTEHDHEAWQGASPYSQPRSAANAQLHHVTQRVPLVSYPCALTQEYRMLKKRVPVPPGFKFYKKEFLGEPKNSPDD